MGLLSGELLALVVAMVRVLLQHSTGSCGSWDRLGERVWEQPGPGYHGENTRASSANGSELN